MAPSLVPHPRPPTAQASAVYHLSLSHAAPTTALQHQTLIPALQRTLAGHKPFTLTLDTLDVLLNEDRSRTFIALASTPRADAALTRLVRKVDKAVQRHGLPRYFDAPRPHVSLLWAVGDREDDARTAVTAVSPPGIAWAVPVEKAELKVGGRTVTVWEA